MIQMSASTMKKKISTTGNHSYIPEYLKLVNIYYNHYDDIVWGDVAWPITHVQILQQVQVFPSHNLDGF